MNAKDAKPLILLVDDAPENLATLAAVLDDTYQVKVATSGARALRICESDPLPELILLDVMMPEMDGLEVCRRLKTTARTREIPVIFVTAMSGPSDEAHGLEAGAVDYITKPISPAVVRQRVRVHLELRRARIVLERLGEHYKSYISTEVASSIQRGEVPAGLASHKRPMTVLFADIVGFTEQTDSMPPAVMTNLLNGYFEAMNVIIARYQGTLDKFIGDSVMVFFGDPITRGPQLDAIACVRMALDIQAELHGLQANWAKLSCGAQLQVRIGVASGSCTVGNFGSRQQLTYTVLGSTVNVAARLEAAAQPGEVLISQETYDMVLHAFRCTPQPELYVKGIARPLQTYVVAEEIRQVELGAPRPVSVGDGPGRTRIGLAGPDLAAAAE